MNTKIMMPSNYNMLTDEEITYISGGDNYDDAVVGVYLFAYGTLAVAGIASFANYVWGVATSRNWISKNKEENGQKLSTGDLFSKGMDALSEYMGKSFMNALVGGFTAVNVATSVGLWPVTAIAWLTA